MDNNMTLRDFLTERTNATELCAIRICGWISFTAWIDHEDMFLLPEKYRNAVVKNHEWGELPIVNSTGETSRIPCHFIDIIDN